MIRFENIVYSTKEPSTNALWLNKGKISYYEGGWRTLIDNDTIPNFPKIGAGLSYNSTANTLDLNMKGTGGISVIKSSTDNSLVIGNNLEFNISNIDRPQTAWTGAPLTIEETFENPSFKSFNITINTTSSSQDCCPAQSGKKRKSLVTDACLFNITGHNRCVSIYVDDMRNSKYFPQHIGEVATANCTTYNNATPINSIGSLVVWDLNTPHKNCTCLLNRINSDGTHEFISAVREIDGVECVYKVTLKKGPTQNGDNPLIATITIEEVAEEVQVPDNSKSLFCSLTVLNANEDPHKVLSEEEKASLDPSILDYPAVLVGVPAGAVHNSIKSIVVEPKDGEDYPSKARTLRVYVGNYNGTFTHSEYPGYDCFYLVEGQDFIDMFSSEYDLNKVNIARTEATSSLNIYKDIVDSGESGQVLMSKDGKLSWGDINILDLVSYGVEWKPNVADPALTRVGNMTYHKTLPIQSGMKGCIYNPMEKKVVYWLDEDNWRYKKGGNPDKGEPEQLARLDGYDGEVFIYVPEFYIRSWDEPDRRCVRISSIKLDDTWEHQPALFMSAYRNTILNTVPEDMGYLSTLKVNSAISVVNIQPYCRGGSPGADDTYDDADVVRTRLGKPIIYINKSTIREYARQSGKELLSYRQYKNILYWLYVIEYANFDCQATYNPNLTAEGFRQGGLGLGFTTYVNSTWEKLSYNPLLPIGYTNDLGNNTGIKNYTIPELTFEDGTSATAKTMSVQRWRGVETNFGESCIGVDGILINTHTIDKDGVSFSEVYTTDNPEFYGTDYKVMTKSGEAISESHSFIKEFDLGTTSEIIPRSTNTVHNQYKCDKAYVYSGNDKTSRGLILGGFSTSWQDAGIGLFYFGLGPDTMSTQVSYKTVCIANV